MDAASLIAQAPAGSFRGSTAGEVRAWRGIRYAEAPTGELRWRAPVAAADVADGVVDALEFGPSCPQPANPAVPIPAGTRYDEDCLRLNVWAPARPGDPLPVMVWLHGGAYAYGSSTQSVYDGAALAAEGVVIVTLNYRLGALGFLDLTRCGEPGDFDGNLALRDVLLALEWVRRNIAAFGGDPDRVTLFGESAGGGLVTTLLAVPSAEGLFHRAIAESSPASSVYGADRAFGVARRFLAELGVSVGDAEEAREIAVDELVRASARVFSEVPAAAPGTIAFAPVIDGELLPEAPVTVLREGRGLPVPLIIGTNKDEASVFKFMKSPLMPVSDDRIREMLDDIAGERPELRVPELGQVRSAYEGLRRQAVDLGIGRDIGFRLPTLWVAEGHSAVAPVWLYRFDHATPMLRLIGLGAAHASEVPYVWRRLDDPSMELSLRLGGRRQAAAISERMSGRWLAFARGGDPDPEEAADAGAAARSTATATVAGAAEGSAEGAATAAGRAAPAWPRYDVEERLTLLIDLQDRVVTDPDADLRRGWGDELLAFP